MGALKLDQHLIVRDKGLRLYEPTWRSMQTFTRERTQQSLDELWLIEHHPVFTQGQAGKPEHILDPGSIMVIQSDRGGQVTYHGPGQIVVYTLIDIHRKNLSLRDLINALEQSIIALLRDYDIDGKTRQSAPGVYVNDAKIAALGLKIRKGCSYHGLSLNVKMDLEPFGRINPCGYSGLKVVQISDFEKNCLPSTLAPALIAYLAKHLGYTTIIEENER